MIWLWILGGWFIASIVTWAIFGWLLRHNYVKFEIK